MNALPDTNYKILQHLVALLCKISKYESINRMNPDNLSLVISTNVFKSPSTNINDFIIDSPLISKLFSLIIRNYDKLFKKTSAFDKDLKGYLGYKEDPLLKLKEDHIIKKEDGLINKQKDVIEGQKPKESNINGYIMRRVYETTESAQKKNYSHDNVIITGEGLIFIENEVLEKEIPFDQITNYSLESSKLKIEYVRFLKLII